MRQFYKPDSEAVTYEHAQFYTCDHPQYDTCTLYLLPDGRGLAAVQKKWSTRAKVTYWGHIDPPIAEDIWQNPLLQRYLEFYADLPENGLYPTVPVRRLMWALGMPPIHKEFWEKDFDDVRLIHKTVTPDAKRFLGGVR